MTSATKEGYDDYEKCDHNPEQHNGRNDDDVNEEFGHDDYEKQNDIEVYNARNNVTHNQKDNYSSEKRAAKITVRYSMEHEPAKRQNYANNGPPDQLYRKYSIPSS